MCVIEEEENTTNACILCPALFCNSVNGWDDVLTFGRIILISFDSVVFLNRAYRLLLSSRRRSWRASIRFFRRYRADVWWIFQRFGHACYNYIPLSHPLSLFTSLCHYRLFPLSRLFISFVPCEVTEEPGNWIVIFTVIIIVYDIEMKKIVR